MESELFRALQAHASAGEEPSEWDIEADSVTTRLRAKTARLYKDPDEAWEAAKSFRGAIEALGHELYGACRIGAVSSYKHEGQDGTKISMPITGWRGYLELWFATER